MKSIRHLTVCSALLLCVGSAMGAKLRVPSVNYPTIQAAIDQAQSNDTIEVAPGTYYENIDFHGKAVRLYGREGAAATTIDGNRNGPVVTCVNGETSNTILEGFTIATGSAEYGGGMYNASSSPTVAHCTFSGNCAYYDGGGMYNYGSSPTVINCTFSNNASFYYNGGGMYNACSSPVVVNCTFSGNSAYVGGGMFNFQGSPSVINCIFASNSPLYYGGGIWNAGSTMVVANCTFTDNFPDGIYNAAGMLIVTNSILWSDSWGEIAGPGDVTATYSNIQGGFPGEGNIDADPLFDATCHLQPGSPCINAGNRADVPDGLKTDLDGNPRIRGTNVDMGAYESSPKATKVKH